MFYKGSGRIHVVEGTMNVQKYISMLQDRMEPQTKEWFGGNDCIFMQDRAPHHTAKACKKHLVDKDIILLDWPGNSPDLNPIETLWPS